MAFFITKHFLVDFPLQFQYMLEQKGVYGADGGVHHSGLHALFTFWILVWFVGPWLALSLAALDGVVHYHVDWLKQNVCHTLTPADKNFWIMLGWDQAAHYFTYILIIGIVVL